MEDLSLLSPQVYYLVKGDVPISAEDMINVYSKKFGKITVGLIYDGKHFYFTRDGNATKTGEQEFRRVMDKFLADSNFNNFAKASECSFLARPLMFYAANGFVPVSSEVIQSAIANQSPKIELKLEKVDGKLKITSLIATINEMENEFIRISDRYFPSDARPFSGIRPAQTTPHEDMSILDEFSKQGNVYPDVTASLFSNKQRSRIRVLSDVDKLSAVPVKKMKPVTSSQVASDLGDFSKIAIPRNTSCRSPASKQISNPLDILKPPVDPPVKPSPSLTDHNMNLPVVDISFPISDAYPPSSPSQNDDEVYQGRRIAKFHHDFSMVPESPCTFCPIDTLTETPTPEDLMAALVKLRKCGTLAFPAKINDALVKLRKCGTLAFPAKINDPAKFVDLCESDEDFVNAG